MSRQLLFLQRRIKYQKGGDSVTHTEAHKSFESFEHYVCERRQGDQYATRKAPSMKGKVGLEKWR